MSRLDPDLSIGILTQRNQRGGRHPAYAALAEAEDVLVATGGAELIDLTAVVSDPSIRARRACGAVVRRAQPSFLLPASPMQSRRRFDVVIAVLTSIWELPLIEAHPAARAAGEVAVWVPEVWPSQFDDKRLRREPYGIADHLFVGTKDAPDVLERILDRQAHALTWAADVVRFRPTVVDAVRPIEILNIGRRIEELHERLLAWSMSDEHFYEYDTTVGSMVLEPRAHRERLAALYRRSSVAVTSYPKHDVYGEACASDIPSRLWEGLAAGCLMIGRAPKAAAQCEIVGDVVVRDLPADADAAICELTAMVDADSIGERWRNLTIAHRAHDWAHRWIELFDKSGWPVPAGLRQRVDELAEWPIAGSAARAAS